MVALAEGSRGKDAQTSTRTVAEEDRCKFQPNRISRASCAKANKLINISRNNLKELSRRKGTPVASGHRKRTNTTRRRHATSRSTKNVSFGMSMASIFVNKVNNIKKKISAGLQGSYLDPLVFGCPHHGKKLFTIAPVTVEEVHRPLGSTSDESSPLDILPTSLLKSCIKMIVQVGEYCIQSRFLS